MPAAGALAHHDRVKQKDRGDPTGQALSLLYACFHVTKCSASAYHYGRRATPLRCMVVQQGLEADSSPSLVRLETGNLPVSFPRPTADYNLALTTISPTQYETILIRTYHGSKIRPARNTSSRNHSHSPKLFLAFQRSDPRNQLVRLQQHQSHPRRSAAMLHKKLAMRPGLDLSEGQQVLRRRLHGWDLW